MPAWYRDVNGHTEAQGASQVNVSRRLNDSSLGDCAESRKLDREGSPAGRIRLAVEDRFYPQNRFTAANTTTIGPGVGDRVAVFAVNGLAQRNTADLWLGTNF
jgi:hypothetical protein